MAVPALIWIGTGTPAFLSAAPAVEDLLPAPRPPGVGQAGLPEQGLVVEQHPPVGALRQAVPLALERAEALHGLRDAAPALPGVRLGTGDLGERLDVPGLGELAHPDAVEVDDVGARPRLEVEGDLGLVLLVVHAARLEHHTDVAALGLLRGLEPGDDPLGRPVGGLGVLAAGDRVGGDGQGDALARGAAVIAGAGAAGAQGQQGHRRHRECRSHDRPPRKS